MLLVVLACTHSPIPLSKVDSEDSGDSNGTTTHAATQTDLDDDGYSTPDDCKDTDASIHPGATEDWDGVDQDCDGRIDGDGHYTGTSTVSATAIYEGTPYRYSLSCPGELTRGQGQFSWTFSCTPDSGDPMAQLLLGATLSLSAADTVQGASWSGEATVASTNGWDTHGDATAAWNGFSQVAVQIQLAKVSLSLDLRGDLDWDGTVASLR